MYCSNCGYKNPDGAKFCRNCGTKLANPDEIKFVETQQPENVSDEKPIKVFKKTLSPKTVDIVKKCLTIGYAVALSGVAIFIFLVLIGLIARGGVYLFNGPTFYKIFAYVSVIFMIIGLLSACLQIVLSYVYNVHFIPKDLLAVPIQRIVAICLAVLCLGLSIVCFVDCGSKNLASNTPAVTEPVVFSNTLYSGKWGSYHCQGVAIDETNGYVYYSYTTKLVKTDFKGNVIGSVEGIWGHLGDIDFNEADGKVYASLVFTNDEIGTQVKESLGIPLSTELPDSFYIAIFDVNKINRVGMSSDGIMRVAFLQEVYNDVMATVTNRGVTCQHRYGCSGVDGITIGPDFGMPKGSRNYLMVACGIYEDTARTDNDYQIIYQFEIENLWNTAITYNPVAIPTTSATSLKKYFVLTGNTSYGIQNLEYDAYTGDYFACVYTIHREGTKSGNTLYTTYVIDGSVAGTYQQLAGYDNNVPSGYVLALKQVTEHWGMVRVPSGLSGMRFNDVSGMNPVMPGTSKVIGDKGIYSFGDGTFYFADPDYTDTTNCSVTLTKFTLDNTGADWVFNIVE